MDSLAPLAVKTLELTKERFTAGTMIGKAVLENAAVRVEEAFGFDALLVRLDAFVWSHTDRTEVVGKYPSTWWDAVKARWYPLWALRKWPVQYTKVIAEVKVLYPDLVLPNQRTATVVRTTIEHDWED